ncbi:cytochrome P450 [Lepidopterella palustris CBS 459.81]|uniref:Cytochrome P450 n=1 Tax=Lepidopterella palustris CBS 459.81 TaxID=1314670 RepID=A0A8E2E2L6_9PEZI|nr:cytochrome P450 [Lepidopterella palustris CBS 459.81]
MATPPMNVLLPPLTRLGGGFGITIAVTVLVLIASFAFYTLSERPYPGLLLIGKDPSERTNLPAKKRWMKSAKKICFDALKETQKPFQVIATNGPLIVIPPKYTEEIRLDERMTFKSWLKKDFFTEYPGFEGFKPAVDNNVFIDSVRIGLTQSLGQIVGILEKETKLCLNESMPLSNEWQETHFDKVALRMIARLSSRTFLPEPLCYNEEWLKISVDYTVDFFTAAYVLRLFPPPIRAVVHWFLPYTRKLRQSVATARGIIEPEVKRRKLEREAAIQAGEKPKKYVDALAWVESVSEKSGEYCDPVYAQLNYALGAVHTTSITFTNTVYNLISQPESIELLREEFISVFKEVGEWNKTSLYKLKLMDSFMKESNRLNPASFMTVNRVANVDITLSDGTVIPKNAALSIPNTSLVDPHFWENPHQFNGKRFFDMRQKPDNESKHQFVTTSDEYLPFGHGKHACPGRFFASNEIKVLLCHLIMNYDFKFKGGVMPEFKNNGPDDGFNKDAMVMFKARTPELSVTL